MVILVCPEARLSVLNLIVASVRQDWLLVQQSERRRARWR